MMITKEQRQERNRQYMKIRYASQSPDERKEHNRKRTKASVSSEQWQRKLEYNRRRFASFTPEQHAAHIERCKISLEKANAARRIRLRGKHREMHLKRLYGLTEGAYALLLEEQGGGCAICGAKPNGSPLPIDHDHVTGAVRAILCRRCNTTLGNMGDDPRLLRKAAEYLESSSIHNSSRLANALA